MNEQQAMTELRSRVRDFYGWSGTPGAPDSIDRDMLSPAQCLEHLMRLWEKATEGDYYSWGKEGWKRKELDDAINVLGLPPLPFK